MAEQACGGQENTDDAGHGEHRSENEPGAVSPAGRQVFRDGNGKPRTENETEKEKME